MIRPQPTSTLFPYTTLFRSGHINIAASGQTMFRRLCAAIGASELIDDPRFKTLPDRSRNRKAMNAELDRSEEHTSELQSRLHLVCRLLLEKKKTTKKLALSI